MLIAVIADTHKNQTSINTAKKHIKESNVDIIIHLGDCIEDIELLKESFNGKVYAVEGNCDNLNKYPKEDILEVNGKKIYFNHGDLYGVKNGLDNLRLKGKEVGADIVLFGHTHEPFKEEKNGMILMNQDKRMKIYNYISKIMSCLNFHNFTYIFIRFAIY